MPPKPRLNIHGDPLPPIVEKAVLWPSAECTKQPKVLISVGRKDRKLEFYAMQYRLEGLSAT